jgi:hypothetical protein
LYDETLSTATKRRTIVETRSIAGFPAYTITTDATIRNPWGRIMKHDLSFKGYHRIRLRMGNKQIMCMISRLMLETFVGPPPSPNRRAAHIDGNKDNVNIDNLKWKTSGENGADEIRRGTPARGRDHGRAKITDEQAREIRKRHAGGETRASLAREYHIGWSTIDQIVNGKTWRHLK